MNQLLLLFDAGAIICQCLSIYLGYKIFTFNKLSKWWLALVLAFLIQGIRRIITTIEDNSLVVATNAIFLDRILAFVISALFLIGLYSVLTKFERTQFDDEEMLTKKKK
jgi:hypothetical protein